MSLLQPEPAMPKNKIPEPTEAINYVKRKLPVPTGKWDQLRMGEHVHAFTVAHSIGAAIVDDIFKIMAKSMEEGTGLGAFKRDMRRIMAEKGWYGRPDKTAKDKKYINRRLDTIYQTNILTAYSAGETRGMLRTAHLYPYWQYQQVQRNTKRQNHSAFHGLILRYDDPFWATGTPPNGWRCQCYRNQLSESQAKTLGGPTGIPQGVDMNSSIPKEWRYDPGREMIAPNFTRYDALKKIKYKGKSALSEIIATYRKEMTGYQLTQAEWNIYISNLPDKSLPAKRLYADAPMMFSTLRTDAAEAIGEDVKLIIKDRSVIHGARIRRASDGSLADVSLSINDMKNTPRKVADPEAIYKDNATGNLVFRYGVDKMHDIKAIFLPGRKLTSLMLHTFFKTRRGALDEDRRYSRIYIRK
ncbi:hypothetical protein S1OALGB6SA_1505 [Olavius algarvensis spirochete endosymbiont]|nr:hypothetical protein S1OALGB6SA_1505 [Olavius algarvensis spirochete endosymbiont]